MSGALIAAYAQTFEAVRDLTVPGNVTVGTTVAGARLTVRGAGTSSAAALRIADTQGTSRLLVQDDGNLGIGTTSPLEAVHITSGSLRQDSAVDPVIVGSVYNATALDGAHSVYVSGRYAYVASSLGNRLTVVDVSNASNPQVVGSVYNATALDDAEAV